PAWAAGSAGNLEDFPVLTGIDALTLLVDHDVNGRGQEAALVCGKRWRDAGREVTLLTPRKLGADFNDLVRPSITISAARKAWSRKSSSTQTAARATPSRCLSSTCRNGAMSRHRRGRGSCTIASRCGNRRY